MFSVKTIGERGVVSYLTAIEIDGLIANHQSYLRMKHLIHLNPDCTGRWFNNGQPAHGNHIYNATLFCDILEGTENVNYNIAVNLLNMEICAVCHNYYNYRKNTYFKANPKNGSTADFREIILGFFRERKNTINDLFK